MDRRIDVEALRTGLDEIIASATGDTRIVIQKDGRDVAMLVSVGDAAPAEDWLAAIHADAATRGLDGMTMEEIDEEIAAYRREKAAGQTAA